MGEPKNTVKRKAVAVKKGQIPLRKLLGEKQGALSAAESAKSKEYMAPNACQEMDLAKVDNNNEENYQEYDPGKDTEDTYDNIDFGKLHNDMRAIVDSKKDPNAGK